MRKTAWLLALTIGICAAAEIQTRAVVVAEPLSEQCAGTRRPEATLFLVGDAGAPRTPEPLLEALRAEAAAHVQSLGSERVAIAFLGDNIYPLGLRAAEDPGRARDEARLLAQLDVVRGSGARGYFVPGNHDWSNGGDDGWEAVKRQTRFVAARGASVEPPSGCPGPVVRTLGDSLALVFLDTQWWLHEGPKPADTGSGCAAHDEASVEQALAAVLRDAVPRRAVVLAHHPLATGGPHGAHFGWREHLFPFLEVSHAAWIPVPVLGSVWPALRMLGVSDQDVTSGAYGRMRASVERGLATAPPLVFAAGHDHNLQVIRRAPARFDLVSGAGSAANTTWAYPVAGTLYASARQGWIRLDAFADGGVALSVRAVGASGDADDVHTGCLTDDPARAE